MNKETAIWHIKTYARKLDLAIYEYFFEGKPKSNVIKELRKYQNSDGGFGNGLEADCWNPNSSPIATNDALFTLSKIDGFDEASGIVNGIINYLKSHDSFDEEKKCWQFAIESNKNYPHAIWWEKNGDGISGYNPTVSLATFLICFSGRDRYYESILKDSFRYLVKTEDMGADSIKCFLLSYTLLNNHGINDIIDLNEYKEILIKRIESSICKDTSKYGKEYVSVPSDYFAGSYSEFITEDIKKLIVGELEILNSLQKEDGGFDISWEWGTDYAVEFQEARRKWRPKITIDKLLFIKMNQEKED